MLLVFCHRYLLVTSPNLFLWMSVTFSMDQLEEPTLLVARRNVLREYIFFWTAAVFFCLPAIVEAVLVSRFARAMLTGSLGKARMTTAHIRSLWHEVLQRVEAAAEAPSKLDGLCDGNRDEPRSLCLNYAQLRIGSNGGGLRRRVFGFNVNNSLRKQRFTVSDSRAKHRKPHRATVEALELGATDCGHVALTANSRATVDGDDLVRNIPSSAFADARCYLHVPLNLPNVALFRSSGRGVC